MWWLDGDVVAFDGDVVVDGDVVALSLVAH